VVTLNTALENTSLPDLSEALQLAQGMNVLDMNGDVIPQRNGLDNMRLDVLNAFINSLKARGFPKETLNDGVLSAFETEINSNWHILLQNQQAGNNEPGFIFIIHTNDVEGIITTDFLPPTQISNTLLSLGLHHEVTVRPTENPGLIWLNENVLFNLELFFSGVSFEESIIPLTVTETLPTELTEVDGAYIVDGYRIPIPPTPEDAPNVRVWGLQGLYGEPMLEHYNDVVFPLTTEMMENIPPIILEGGLVIDQWGTLGYIDNYGHKTALIIGAMFPNCFDSDPVWAMRGCPIYIPIADHEGTNIIVTQAYNQSDPYDPSAQRQLRMITLNPESYSDLQGSRFDNPVPSSLVYDLVFPVTPIQQLLAAESLVPDQGMRVIINLRLDTPPQDPTSVYPLSVALERPIPGVDDRGLLLNLNATNFDFVGDYSQELFDRLQFPVTGQEYQ
jgi:hypothetical protein